MRRERGERAGSTGDCRLGLWRGYVTAQFYACETGPDDAFLCSPSFRTWRPPWRPKLHLEETPEAASALAALVAELERRGWRESGAASGWAARRFVRPPDPVGPRDPASIGDDRLLRALDRAAGEDGATAAELGRVLYGDAAPTVRNLPLRLGNRLRALQRQGKVVRREQNGVNRWRVADPGR